MPGLLGSSSWQVLSVADAFRAWAQAGGLRRSPILRALGGVVLGPLIPVPMYASPGTSPPRLVRRAPSPTLLAPRASPVPQARAVAWPVALVPHQDRRVRRYGVGFMQLFYRSKSVEPLRFECQAVAVAHDEARTGIAWAHLLTSFHMSAVLPARSTCA